jgi:hypothetical protein
MNQTEAFNIARFPTKQEALAFANNQAKFIELSRITDANELHPELKDPMPFSVLYRLKKNQDPTKPYAFDRYGNMLPSSLF